MAQRYIDIDAARLEKLHDGLELLESLDREAMHEFDLHIYGLTQDGGILDAAKESIADSADISEEDVELSEVAVAIPISSDTIYALSGSGIRLKNEDFAYMGEEGEGIRTTSMTFAHFKPTVALTSFSQLAIAFSDSWLDDFLKQFGNKESVQIHPRVRRTEEATQPSTPILPEAPPIAPPANPAFRPKQTSQIGGQKLTDILEDFLG